MVPPASVETLEEGEWELKLIPFLLQCTADIFELDSKKASSLTDLFACGTRWGDDHKHVTHFFDWGSESQKLLRVCDELEALTENAEIEWAILLRLCRNKIDFLQKRIVVDIVSILEPHDYRHKKFLSRSVDLLPTQRVEIFSAYSTGVTGAT
eukprot:PhF_6_TR43807/c0_g1_i1/m.67161